MGVGWCTSHGVAGLPVLVTSQHQSLNWSQEQGRHYGGTLLTCLSQLKRVQVATGVEVSLVFDRCCGTECFAEHAQAQLL
jgi:hypothetical protein